ncbi:cytochrome P450 [Nocardia seriolae]|uniref:cytochrome P450 n=1 Tax=Nocardia seriolae TaxID=37332 RepID=UPI0006921B36|nr:cytochrome P450 [Nocardia seriolae]MTJ64968.1 cytochrome P450 [Nocardia seriolae]MTJ71822.1 cytochrome P450 [Nocardia seriolae]MTJ89782.1 cytochrome P450 [Nocardia seriolae]MTK33758.1 cytochrome P450 [Nocardia seriolae]MTK42913.1 cytochrome P450 [Nocardia seriolae]
MAAIVTPTSRTVAPTSHRLPPGPLGAQRIPRHVAALRTDAAGLFARLRRDYGDTVRLPLGLLTATLAFHPDAIKHVLQDNNANYVRGPGYERFRLFMGDGLLTTDGDAWRERRRTVNPLFHRSAVEGMVDTMASATAVVLDRWERHGRSGYTGDVLPAMMRITLGALGRIMFDADLDGDRRRVGAAMETAVEAMVFRGTVPELLPPWVPFPSNLHIARARADLYAVLGRAVAAHRTGAGAGRPDLITLLLTAAESPDGPALTDADVRDELMTVFMAGHETTGTGLAWALHELAHAPVAQERMREEADRVFGGRAPVAADLPQLTYTGMAVEESLRLHPPIWVYPRASRAADELGGWHVPAGECVFLSPYVTHRHPDYWVTPERFDPERFTETAKRNRPRYTYFPFGGGQRKCVGEAMATTQMRLTLAMLVSRFTIHPAGPGDPALRTAVSLRPVGGLPLRIVPRHS